MPFKRTRTPRSPCPMPFYRTSATHRSVFRVDTDVFMELANVVGVVLAALRKQGDIDAFMDPEHFCRHCFGSTQQVYS